MKYGKSSFIGAASLEGFWSSQVPEPKSLYIRFRSFCRKLSLSPILLNWRAHSISASEKECKTSKLNWQHSKLQPARMTSWVGFPWNIPLTVSFMYTCFLYVRWNTYRHTTYTNTLWLKQEKKKKSWTKTFTLKSFKVSWMRQILSY